MTVSGFIFFLKLVIGVGTTTNAYLQIAVQITRLALLSAASKALTKQPSLQTLSQEKLATVRSNVEPRRSVYGRDLLSGPLCFINTQGSDRVNLFQSVILTAHECDAITEYWVDVPDPANDHPNTVILASDIAPGTFNVLTGLFAEVSPGVPIMQIYTGLGEDPAPILDPLLNGNFPLLWDAGHDLNGTSNMTVGMHLQTGHEDRFQIVPQIFRSLIDGKKIYDPRKDSTNGGAGLHRLNDATTWEWSENPALCVADYLRARSTDYPLVGHVGFTALDAEVGWPNVITAADICDELVAIPTASTQKRYTCNGTIDSSMQPRDIIDSMVDSMLGRIVYVNGIWQMWAGAAIASTITLSEKNLRDGGVDLQPQAKHLERWNRVRGKYVNPEEFYQPTGYIEQRSATFEADDGGEPNYKELDFNFTKNEFECQRNAIVTLKKSRNQRVLVMPCNWSALRLQPAITVDVDLAVFGFVGEKFIVTEWKLGADGVGIDLVLVQETDSVWADPLEADYTPRSATAIGFNNIGVPPPTGLAAASVTNGMLLSWVNPPINTFTGIEIHVANENVRASAVLVATVQGDKFFDTISAPQQERFYWIRAINKVGQVSTFEPNLTTTTVRAFPGIQQSAISPDPFIRQGAGFWSLGTGATYEVGAGTDGTDAIKLATQDVATALATYKSRRGPDEWDFIVANGMSIEVRLRLKIAPMPANFLTSVGVEVRAIVTDLDAVSNPKAYLGVGGRRLYSPLVTNTYYDFSYVIDINGEDGLVQPRYLQLRVSTPALIANHDIHIDIFDATVTAGVFNPTANFAKTIGLVPDSGTTITGRVLKDDGTWGSAGATRIAGSSGAAGPDITWQNLTADVTSVISTLAVKMTTTAVGVGTWKFKYTLICQASTVANNGMGFGVNHTGTVGEFAARYSYVSTGNLNTTGVMDNATTVTTRAIMEGKAGNTLNAVIGSTTTGVAAVDADMLVVVEGIIVVTATGSLQLLFANEDNSNTVTMKADSILELHKIE